MTPIPMDTPQPTTGINAAPAATPYTEALALALLYKRV
jgi:hypothetical protein